MKTLRAALGEVGHWIAEAGSVPWGVLPPLSDVASAMLEAYDAARGDDGEAAHREALRLLDALAAWRRAAEETCPPELAGNLAGFLRALDGPSSRVMVAACATRNAFLLDPRRQNRSVS